MGKGYGLKCGSCDYCISVTEGVGMAYSPHAVFYGHCDDPTQNWSVALPDGRCEMDKPLLLSLVKSKRIKDKAFGLLASGATPDEYGHGLFVCPKCMRLANRFYFKLASPAEQFEPDYRCSKCKSLLRRIEIEFGEEGNGEIMDKNHEKIDWKCPECGGDSLVHSGDIILWD
jgi:DNA-directed RNA polymerase subunit RPC12/RpoP